LFGGGAPIAQGFFLRTGDCRAVGRSLLHPLLILVITDVRRETRRTDEYDQRNRNER
jgi:hypothetical protein